MIKKGIVLAGGEGKRLASLRFDVPKPLVPLKGKPLVNFNLGLLARHGVRNVLVIIRPSDRSLYREWHKKHGKDFPTMRIEIVEEPEPMGTFGYFFHHLRDWTGEDDVIVTNGDEIKEIDLRAMHDFHRRIGTPATVALMKMEKPDDYGAVVLEDGKIIEFIEKRPNLPAGFVSTGLYVISPRVLDEVAARIPKEKRFLMFETDLFPVLARKKKLGGFACEGRFFDCGTPERLAEAIRSI
jgi:mannose-1-phosphate guanylyltransferase / phosphomannomutase